MTAVYSVDRMPPMITIGVQTETNVEEVAFDVTAWGDMDVTVWHRLPGQTDAYLASSRREDNVVYWQITATDTQTPGIGRVQLMGRSAGALKLSRYTDTRIMGTITATTQDPPTAPPTWLDTVTQMIGDGGGAVLTLDGAGNATAINGHALADTYARERVEALEVEPDGNLELFETITISESDTDMLEIIRDQYTGIKQMRIDCTTPAQASAQNIFVSFTLGASIMTIGGRAYYGSNTKGFAIFKMRPNAGYWDGESEIGAFGSTGTKYGQVNTGMVDVATHPEITKIRIYTFSPGFGAGTKFEIYGVKEDA